MHLGRHISGQFNTELESIRTHALTMGGMVEQQLSLALLALHKHDTELASKVSRDDQKVDRMEMIIDEACARIIAKRQPTARDLRLVIAIIKSVPELERIGDTARRIARVAAEPFNQSQITLLVSLDQLAKLAIDMLHQVLDAFARMDVEAAVKVYQMDDLLDAEYKKISHQLMDYMAQNPTTIPQIMKVMKAAQSIERVGDRVQNICEYIIYCVRGKDVRHSNSNVLLN